MHKIYSTGTPGMLETVAFTEKMLDTGSSMLDNLHAIRTAIHKHPEPSIKDQPMTARVFVETVLI